MYLLNIKNVILILSYGGGETMGEQYYIAKIGNMWVDSYHGSIMKIHLTMIKKYARHLKEEDAQWIKENTGAEIFKVTVNITEEEVSA